MKSHHVFIWTLSNLIAQAASMAIAEDWLGKSGPKIQIMPKSAKPAEFTLYSDVIPRPVRNEKVLKVTIYDFKWPMSATKENGQWLQIEDDGSVSRTPVKGWINKDQIIKLDAAANVYGAELQKAQGEYTAAYRWLLGVVWEFKDQKSVARFQYSRALENGQTGIAANRAHWGFARLSAELYRGDPKGVDKKDYLEEVVDKLFKNAQDNTAPAFYVDWGKALERALPDPTPQFVEFLTSQITMPLTCYSPDLSDPTQHQFDRLSEELMKILSKYKQAEILSSDPPTANAPDVTVHCGTCRASERVARQFEEDRGAWDVPHRAVGSLYARYCVKRCQFDFNNLFIDVNGVKAINENTVTADDEFVRALRRQPDAQSTHNQRANLYFTYFSMTHLRTLPSKQLAPRVELTDAYKQWKQASDLRNDATRVLQAQQQLATYWTSIINPRNSREITSPEAATARETAMSKYAKAIERRDDYQSDVEDAEADLTKATVVWNDVRAGILSSIDRVDATIKEFMHSETQDLQAQIENVKVMLNSETVNTANVLTELSSIRRHYRSLLEDRKTSSDPVEAKLANDQFDLYFGPNIAQAEHSWQLAFNEALAATALSNYRDSESLDLLARICYQRPPLDNEPVTINFRPMLAEAVRFQKLAAEFAVEDKKRLEFTTQYIYWYNELNGNPLTTPAEDLQLAERIAKMVAPNQSKTPDQSPPSPWVTGETRQAYFNAKSGKLSDLQKMEPLIERSLVGSRLRPPPEDAARPSIVRPRTYISPPPVANLSGFAN